MGTYDTVGGTPRHDPAADRFPACEVCKRDCADCICPECPICHESGNPQCLGYHMNADGTQADWSHITSSTHGA